MRKTPFFPGFRRLDQFMPELGGIEAHTRDFG